jgi:hypothetical protein
MELDQILKLIDAGFTKADIEAMSAPAEESTEPKAPAAPVEEPKEAAPAAEPKPAEPTANPDFSALLEEMKGIRKQLQMQAILHDGFTPASPDDAEKIMASIINPPIKGKE